VTFLKAESALVLVCERDDPQPQTNSTTSPHQPFDAPDANFIIRSSDNVNFRVHKSLLAMVSPFFKDLLSLPQPPDGEIVDGLPVVQLPESSELLNSLLSVIYPVPTVVPDSYEKVLYVLATCQQ
jgi:BTB/POZ domain